MDNLNSTNLDTPKNNVKYNDDTTENSLNTENLYKPLNKKNIVMI